MGLIIPVGSLFRLMFQSLRRLKMVLRPRRTAAAVHVGVDTDAGVVESRIC